MMYNHNNNNNKSLITNNIINIENYTTSVNYKYKKPSIIFILFKQLNSTLSNK